MKKFELVEKYKGYINKKDVTNTDSEFLVPGSQNVLINDADKIQIRKGFTLDGVAGSGSNPIVSSYDWNTSTGVERNLRVTNAGVLEYRYVDSLGAVTYRTLLSGLTASFIVQFAEWWSSTEVIDHLLCVDGTANMYMWSGAVATLTSNTTTTLTKSGTTWAEDRFLTAGTRSVVINGTTYAYTGGESTTTLTGVTPDASGEAVSSIVHQSIRTTANQPGSAVDNDIILTDKNHVYIADLKRRDVFVSKNTNYADFTFSSLRIPSEGALLTLDSPPIGFVTQENSVYISGSKDDWYQTKFTLSDDLTKETLSVEKLKSGPGQGAIAQSAIGKIKNSVIFFSNERTVDTLGRIENIDTPQAKPLSDPIKLELDNYSITIRPHILYFKNKTYIAFPSEGRVLIYDHEKQFWQPPQILAIRRFAIIGGELYGHSSQTNETVKLFTGTSDNSNPISATAAFAYRNYGRPDWKKIFNEWFSEGYISSNTKLTMALKYDFGGFTSIVEKVIDGTNEGILFSTTTDNSIGKVPLGSLPLGSVTDSPSNLSKFRVIHEVTKNAQDFYEIQVLYQSDQIDAEWELLRTGGNITLSTNDNIEIKD